MKIAVSIKICEQISYDDYKTITKTKLFRNSSTLLEIRTWVKEVIKSPLPVELIDLTYCEFSNAEQ